MNFRPMSVMDPSFHAAEARHSARSAVVLVAAEDAAANSLANALAAAGMVARRCPAAEGLAMAECEPFAAIVSRWSDDWLRWLESHAPAPVFVHVGSPPPPAMLAAAARGLDAAWCRDSTDILRIVRSLRPRPRRAPRWRADEGVRLAHTRPHEGCWPVLDCSSAGLAFRVPHGSPLGMLLPGSVLNGCTVTRDDRSAIADAEVRIRSIAADGDGYRIGVEFCARSPSQERSADATIDEATKIAALMLTAVRCSGIEVARRGFPRRQRLADGAIDWDGGVLTSSVHVAGDDQAEVVDGRFEVAHTSYSFSTVALSTSPLRLRLPVSLERWERRDTLRRPAPGDAWLRFAHGLTGQEAALRIEELSGGGVAVVADDRLLPLPCGLMLPGARLESAQGEIFEVCAVVRSVTRVDDRTVRCGLQIDFGRREDLRRYSSWVVRGAFPAVEPGSDVEPHQLYGLLAGARALPPALREQDVTPVFERMRLASPSIHRSLVVKGDGQLVAHFCGVRRYEGTWTLQHLASGSHDGCTAWGLMSAMVALCHHEPDTNFVHANYAAANAFSARAIGSIVSGITGAGQWHIVHRSMHQLDGMPPLAPQPGIEVRRAATWDDQLAGERIISQWEPPLLMAANDWQAATLPLHGLAALYRRHGLLRQRTLFIAHCDGRAVGFAVAEVSQTGLNVREDLSAARLWVARDAASLRGAVEAGLLRALGRHYAENGRRSWPLITAPAAAASNLRCAVQPVRFVEVTVRRGAIGAMCALWEHMSRKPLHAGAASAPRSAARTKEALHA